jgi:D-glycero-alpha-D-manno-heptose 1-phosphate guanylyltransferase
MIAKPTANTRVRLEAAGKDVPIVLLVGGMGTRLRSVLPSTPKPLAFVGDTAFLELLVLQLRAQGMRRLVMCTGYLADQIEAHFGDGRKWNVEIEYSKETQPLGTAGAVKFAERYIGQAAEFLVMNGDSFLEMDLRQLLRFHREHSGLISMAVRRVPNAARYGTVRLDTLNRITGFAEKAGAEAPGIVNGGVYVFSRAVLQHIPEGPASLEKEIFPRLLPQGMYAAEQDGVFVDIGTPEDYARAQELCRALENAARGERNNGDDAP